MDAGTITAIGGAIAAVMAPLGVAIAFVWRKVERLAEKVEDCEARDARRGAAFAHVSAAARLMLTELRRIDDSNPFLTTIEALLHKAWKVNPDTPGDMIDKLGEML